MREMLFTMDRPGLVQVGEEVEIIEGSTPAFYYYTLKHSYAMSGNYMYYERLKSRKGIIKSIAKGNLGFDVIVEFNEE